VSLLIAIESATLSSKVIIARDGKIIDESALFKAETTSFEFQNFILGSAAVNDFAISEIDFVCVDIGPGRLSATRSGVSFANALAFSIERPIVPLTYFDLIGYETACTTGLPVACVVQASNGMGYVGLFDKNELQFMTYGTLLDQLADATKGLGDYAVAGQFSADLVSALDLPAQRVNASGMPSSQTILHRSLHAIEGGGTTRDPVEPITEQHGCFMSAADVRASARIEQ
jgi:tRNA A37 threonylcarbamoyladenosine modification protein TsaB